jgi:predicted ABC-type ATPase
MGKPAIYVLAGVNGAGKSAIGGYQLTRANLAWFNPDTFARTLVNEYGYEQTDANAAAWGEGVRRLDLALSQGTSYAFETTLGGQTIIHKLIRAAATHDILIWFCGLRDAEQHIARVQFRVAHGGHDIPPDKIRERCRTSLQNLLGLMPHAAHLRVYDNSAEAALGEPIPEPRLVLETQGARMLFPTSLAQARDTPDWAKPVVELAFELSTEKKGESA